MGAQDTPLSDACFQLGDQGHWGWVEEGRVRWAYAPLDAAFCALGLPMLSVKNMPAPHPWPWVEVVTSHEGVCPEGVLECLLAAGVQGGWWWLAQAMAPSMHRGCLCYSVRAARVRVASTRCPQGQVVQPPGRKRRLEVTSLLADKARISLMLQLLVQQHHAWTNGGGLGVGPQ